MLRSEFKQDAELDYYLKYSMGTINIAVCKIVLKKFTINLF